jgi:hypothetical protein
MSETPTYEVLLEAARADPANADFFALRLAYARQHPYSPQEHVQYMKDLVQARATIRVDLEQGHLERARQAIEGFLERDYLDADVHRLAASAYDKLGDRPRATFHREFAHGLFDSVFRSGDGQSRETAFIVINVREEYLVLRALGLRYTVQRLDTQTGHLYDVFSIEGRPASEAYLYFHVYLPDLGMPQRQTAPPERKPEAAHAKRSKRRWWQFWEQTRS